MGRLGLWRSRRSPLLAPPIGPGALNSIVVANRKRPNAPPVDTRPRCGQRQRFGQGPRWGAPRGRGAGCLYPFFALGVRHRGTGLPWRHRVDRQTRARAHPRPTGAVASRPAAGLRREAGCRARSDRNLAAGKRKDRRASRAPRKFAFPPGRCGGSSDGNGESSVYQRRRQGRHLREACRRLDCGNLARRHGGNGKILALRLGIQVLRAEMDVISPSPDFIPWASRLTAGRKGVQ